ncbi:intradiol ring-cleavage dioxygenase [Gordonia hydrophobica]|uniref:Intradiol ring-cleavage dioxygenase n=1 Tax=Gordonia hydrophobica TaxID=40516 RepID=A0ABZ2TYC7_9ACTN|nr:intradiol ring-cleavage dioxygenase [Gordonia hydrophobica]MBM7366539.1 protocatechuate 3,4-dioxygenase beta subunit [Gordonia hydrophobica]
MPGFPAPTPTPQGPTYEGRRLHHPDEDVVDQGASFDLQTLLSRRRMLGVLGIGAGTAFLAACGAGSSDGGQSSSATSSTAAGSIDEIPDETAGPYPGDGSNGPDVLEESGIVRRDITKSLSGGSAVAGVPLTVTLNLTDIANSAPYKDAAVYVWHCDAKGQYSMYSSGVENETFLRGVQVADAQGSVTFTSIFPGCYQGRWPHIHFEVYPAVGDITDHTKAVATSQIALPQDVCTTVYRLSDYTGSASNLAGVTLATDTVFSDDSAKLQLATMTGSAGAGYTATLAVGVDTRTTPTAGSMPSGGPGGGGTPPGSGPR